MHKKLVHEVHEGAHKYYRLQPVGLDTRTLDLGLTVTNTKTSNKGLAKFFKAYTLS